MSAIITNQGRIQQVISRVNPRTLRQQFKFDSLFRNSVYLMMATGVLSMFGLIFWAIAARLYPVAQIGLATAIISVTTLLSGLSLAGFNTALIRFIPAERKLGSLVNTTVAAVATLTVIITLAYLAGLHWFAPGLLILRHNTWFVIGFIVVMVLVSVNSLTDSVFIGRRESQYNLGIYSIFGAVKALLPLAAIGFGAAGIVGSYAIAVAVAIILSFIMMARRYDYRLTDRPDFSRLRELSHYSVSSYIAAFLTGLPLLALPSIILGRLGAAEAAYFYMAATICALLAVVPAATTQSVLAEGSHDGASARDHARQGLRLILGVLAPVTIVVVIAAPWLLGIFGHGYATRGTDLLRLMAAASLPAAVSLAGATVLRLEGRLKMLVALGALPAGLTLAAVYILPLSLTEIGWIVLGSQVIGVISYAIALPGYLMPRFRPSRVLSTPQP